MQWQSRHKRRTFLQYVASAFVCGSVPASLEAAKIETSYRYAGRLGSDGRDSIEVFKLTGGEKTLVQEVPSKAPVSLAIHPNRQFLYAANRISSYGGLPRGTVESFRIDQRTGTLTLIQTQALSLSGTEPRSLAVTPDGRHLIVAIFGGGAYNVFPVARDGSIGAATAIFKELGCSVHPDYQAAAHPHTVIVDKSGRVVLTSDLGCDQLNVFALSEKGELERRSKLSLPPGFGPGGMVLHPGGNTLYVLHELQGAVSCHHYREEAASIESHFQLLSLTQKGTEDISMSNGLRIDDGGRVLEAGWRARVFSLEIDPADLAIGCR